MRTITIACPEAHIGDANQFARCIGLGPDDDKTFGLPLWQDAGGNLYAVASGLVSDTFEATATGVLVEPEWGCDLAAAQRAQLLVRLPDPETGALTATPTTIAATFADDALAAIAGLGLAVVTQEGSP